MNDFPSQNSDMATDEESLSEFRFSRAQSYFDKSIIVRLLIGICFAFFLFLFLHFRATYVENLELGTAAKRYVVAQVDFAFPDEEATIILKQEAAHEIGTIWRLKEEQVNQRAHEFQKYITQNGEGYQEWERLSRNHQFHDISLVINLVSDKLALSRFTDIKTIHRIESFDSIDLPIPEDNFYPFFPSHGVSLPLQFWSHFGKKVFKNFKIPQSVAIFILNYFEKTEWDFEIDQGMEYTIRKLAQNKVAEKFTRVRAGERLIDRGEKVTTRHIAMLQAMKEKLSQKRDLFDPVTVLGTLMMTLLFLGVGAFFIRENHRDIFYSNRKLALLTTILTLALLLAKAVELFLLKNTTNFIDSVRFPLFVPFAAILIASLMNLRIAAFAVIFLSIIYAIILAVETIPFLIVNILTAMVAVMSVKTIRRRKEVFVVCAKAWLASLLIIIAFNLYENNNQTFSFLSDFISTFLFMALTAVLVVGLLPILESTFQMMTDITLMEFMDPSNELLKRLTIEAPGTYQHSMVVGHLAEAAASAIGANGLFCRVATHYHDIGKLINPQYFTENQLGGFDMHQLLTPIESTQVIIAHVSEGVAMARKAGLPEQFIDIIKEHHGTTLVYYFYHKQLELMGGDKNRVDKNDFRYSGPKPRTKESSIILISDSLEAASRCLDQFNEHTISNLVDELIAQKMEDGQFDESLLSLEELGIVKETLIKTLLAASHPRIKYPPHHPGEEG